MKKWFVSVFVTAFILSLSTISLADSVRDGGTCSDSITDGYENCMLTYHVGDNKAGGRDDYDFIWTTRWKARTATTVYIDYMKFQSLGVSSGNRDILGNTNRGDNNCATKRVYNINCTEQVDNWYVGNPLELEKPIVDFENGKYYYPNVSLNPSK